MYPQVYDFSLPESDISLNTINYMSKLYSNFVKYGDPAFDGDPIDGYIPVKPNEINFLDVTPDGLVLGRSPNGENIIFMDRIVSEAKTLIAENDNAPPTPEFDLICYNLTTTH